MEVSESVATCAQRKLSPVVACGHNWSTEAHLMAKPAAAAVNHNTDLADLVDAHLGRGPRIKNLVNHLNMTQCRVIRTGDTMRVTWGRAPEFRRNGCRRRGSPFEGAPAFSHVGTPVWNRHYGETCVRSATCAGGPCVRRSSACARTPRSAPCPPPTRSPRAATWQQAHTRQHDGYRLSARMPHRRRCAPVHTHLQRRVQRGSGRRNDAL